ncbi:MAG: response regulator, partial [Candidatus Omnitrophota bacterium]
ITAPEGKIGIDLAREEKPDAILLDIVMPKMDGTDVAEILVNDPKTKYAPIIFLTAVVTDEEIGIEPTREIGGHHFIAKTADSKKLVDTIKIILKELSRV